MFTVDGSTVSGFHRDSVSNVLISKSLHYDSLRTEVWRCVREKLVRNPAVK